MPFSDHRRKETPALLLPVTSQARESTTSTEGWLNVKRRRLKGVGLVGRDVAVGRLAIDRRTIRTLPLVSGGCIVFDE